MSRADAVGLFWEDKTTPRGEHRERPQPPIPDTGWITPREFPNLSSAKVMAIDVETYDPELITKGPGWARGVGHLVGVAVGVENYNWYFPMRHEVESDYNMNPDHVLAWCKDTFKNKNQTKVGANLTYDIGWLRQEGVHVAGALVDIQFAESLLHEQSHVNLDAMGNRYLGTGKETNYLYQWCYDFYGGSYSSKQRANIYRAPPRLVGPYAEGDVRIPLQIAPLLYRKLQEEGLLELFNMECVLIRLMLDMRFRGVRVDINKAEEVRDTLEKKQIAKQQQLNSLVGFEVETTKGESIARAFNHLGLSYPLTAKSKKPSFTKKFMEDVKNPVTDAINEIRKLAKLRGTFIESYILGSHVNGIIHGQFHPMRSDEGGTRSGRFSSSTPNLQNIPIRDKELAHLIRGLFLPDEYCNWVKYDYSQIEYRFLVHFAVGIGAMEARQKYITDPRTDYHEWTMNEVAPVAKWDISTEAKKDHMRRPIKNINFGLIYGMGEKTLSDNLGISLKEGKALFAHYHKALPFAKSTMEATSNEAQELGYITTILGRRSRFDLWEPNTWGIEEVALPYDSAILRYGGNIKRAKTHKALNRRLQGSAADLLKKAMHDAYHSGVLDSTGIPMVTVHDELGFSDDGKRKEAFKELEHIMETAIQLTVPVKVDKETGPDWGHVK